jgi:hypothetical protein
MRARAKRSTNSADAWKMTWIRPWQASMRTGGFRGGRAKPVPHRVHRIRVERILHQTVPVIPAFTCRAWDLCTAARRAMIARSRRRGATAMVTSAAAALIARRALKTRMQIEVQALSLTASACRDTTRNPTEARLRACPAQNSLSRFLIRVKRRGLVTAR